MGGEVQAPSLRHLVAEYKNRGDERQQRRQ
jgi:hypothetical protein